MTTPIVLANDDVAYATDVTAKRAKVRRMHERLPGLATELVRLRVDLIFALGTDGGPYLFGTLSTADAMYAPVCTRFLTYDVKLDGVCAAYCDHIMALPDMIEWAEAARIEPDEVRELDAEFSRRGT